MRFNWQKNGLWMLYLSLSGFAGSGCVTIQDLSACSAAGHISAGGLCSSTNSGKKTQLTFTEMLDFLNAQPLERTCVPVPGFPVCAQDQTTGTAVNLPKRGAAIAMSASDWAEFHLELEQTCRELGPRCSAAAAAAIGRMREIQPSPQAIDESLGPPRVYRATPECPPPRDLSGT